MNDRDANNLRVDCCALARRRFGCGMVIFNVRDGQRQRLGIVVVLTAAVPDGRRTVTARIPIATSTRCAAQRAVVVIRDGHVVIAVQIILVAGRVGRVRRLLALVLIRAPALRSRVIDTC